MTLVHKAAGVAVTYIAVLITTVFSCILSMYLVFGVGFLLWLMTVEDVCCVFDFLAASLVMTTLEDSSFVVVLLQQQQPCDLLDGGRQVGGCWGQRDPYRFLTAASDE
jgi:hypothetical protein